MLSPDSRDDHSLSVARCLISASWPAMLVLALENRIYKVVFVFRV